MQSMFLKQLKNWCKLAIPHHTEASLIIGSQTQQQTIIDNGTKELNLSQQ